MSFYNIYIYTYILYIYIHMCFACGPPKNRIMIKSTSRLHVWELSFLCLGKLLTECTSTIDDVTIQLGFCSLSWTGVDRVQDGSGEAASIHPGSGITKGPTMSARGRPGDSKCAELQQKRVEVTLWFDIRLPCKMNICIYIYIYMKIYVNTCKYSTFCPSDMTLVLCLAQQLRLIPVAPLRTVA